MTDYNPFSLEGKNILITGASSGIGKATAIECAKLGAQIWITGRNPDRLYDVMRSLDGTGHQSIICELINDDEMMSLVKQLPQLDGVFMSAGIADTTLVNFLTKEKIDRVFDINFCAPALLLRALIKNRKIKKYGSVVLMSSAGGITMFNPGNGIYGASKAALQSLTKFAALELASKNIRVNCICPAMVETPILHNGSISEKDLETEVSKYPLKRLGTPEEIAFSAIYFLSDVSKWTTGSSLFIDGGASLI